MTLTEYLLLALVVLPLLLVAVGLAVLLRWDEQEDTNYQSKKIRENLYKVPR